MRHALHITMETLFVYIYLFDGSSFLFSFDARGLFEAEHANYLDLINRNKGAHLGKKMKIYLEEFNSTWSFPVLLSELMFGGFYEYVITSHHIKIRNYISISYYEKLCLSPMIFLL